MTFTDDDLKRLKKELDLKTVVDSNSHDILALLARLEASEQALKAFVDLEADKMNYDTVVALLSEWRKAAGKL